jgi:hypothetical protein
MYLKTNCYKHEEAMFNRALGIKDISIMVSRERIFFVTMVNAIVLNNLYGDNKQDAPREMRTATGDLERCMKLVNSEEEYAYTLLMFHNFHKLSLQTITAHLAQINDEMSEEEKSAINMLKMLGELKEKFGDHLEITRKSDDDDDEEESLFNSSNKNELPINKLDPFTLLKRVDFIIKAKHNFTEYLKILAENYKNTELLEYVKESTKEVDSMLNNILSNSDEE